MDYTIEGLDSLRSVEELSSHQAALKARQTELNAEAKGLPFNQAQRTEWAAMLEVDKEITDRVEELHARLSVVEAAADDTRRIERPTIPHPARTSRIPDNIHALAEYRQFARDVDDLPGLYHEGAKRFLDGIDTDKAQALNAMLGEVVVSKADGGYPLELRYLECSGPVYERAFEKYLKGLGLTVQEQAALGTYTNSGADGGYAVPVLLDPTLIPTSDLEISDIRRIARVVPITGKEWNGVTSGGVTASRVGEHVAITPTSPTLAQPRIVPTAVKVVIPFSVEVDGDWAQLGSEMSREIADSKINEEATTFTTGSGDGATGPQGIERMADTSIIWTQASGAFGVEDIYALETDTATGAGGNPLPERFRTGASFLGNKSIYNKIRQMSVGTVGEGSIWVRGLASDRPAELIGYPAFENSVMDATLTNGNDILILGKFNPYFTIVDRVGMSVELVAHMVDGSGQLTGDRGIFAWWRNGSKILSSNAFRKLRVGEGS